MAPQRPSLPRFGLRLMLPETFDTASYMGYGPGDSYADKRHHDELQPSSHAVLCIDARHAGIGSNSCGSALDPAWQVSDKEWHVQFRMEPAPLKEV